LRRQAAIAQHRGGRMPVADAEFLLQIGAVFFAVVAHVHEDVLAVALDQDVAVRQFANALVMRAEDDAADRVVDHGAAGGSTVGHRGIPPPDPEASRPSCSTPRSSFWLARESATRRAGR
nr:hypothetical protein [Tanacetum cinerariifolium]